jgi:hypothetical protein
MLAFHPALYPWFSRILAAVTVIAALGCHSPTDPLSGARLTPVQVQGFVTWSDGSPVQGVKVDALGFDAVATTVSDSEGHYALRWTELCIAGSPILGPYFGPAPNAATYHAPTCSAVTTCTTTPQRVDCIYQL